MRFLNNTHQSNLQKRSNLVKCCVVPFTDSRHFEVGGRPEKYHELGGGQLPGADVRRQGDGRQVRGAAPRTDGTHDRKNNGRTLR